MMQVNPNLFGPPEVKLTKHEQKRLSEASLILKQLFAVRYDLLERADREEWSSTDAINNVLLMLQEPPPSPAKKAEPEKAVGKE